MQANKDSIKVTGLDHEAEVLGLALAVKAKSLVLKWFVITVSV